MIPVSDAFAAANALLQKKPIYLIEIGGYFRAFTMRSKAFGGIDPATVFASLPPDIVLEAQGFGNIGGLSLFPGTVTLNDPIAAGDVLLAFMVHGDTAAGAEAIADTELNTWTPILGPELGPSGTMVAWSAIAKGGPAGNAVQFTTGANRANSAFFVVKIPAAYASFVVGSNSGSGEATVTTSDGDTLSVPNGPNVSSGWTMFSVSFGPKLALGFVNFSVSGQGPTNSDQSIIEAIPGAGPTYIVMGTQASAFDWLVNIDPLKMTVSDLDGSSDLSDLVFNVQDRTQQLTADLATFVFEGKPCKLLAGFVGMDLADYATLCTMVVDTVDCDNNNTEYKFTCSDVNLKKLSRVVYAAGDDGFATDSNHPRTVSGHPLDILMSALTQVGAKFDAAKIAYYRDFVFSGAFMKFVLTTAPEAKEFITKELMMPLGMYIRPNNLGVLTINSFYPVSFPFGGYTPPVPPVMEAVVSLTPEDANQTEVPVPLEAPLVNEVIFRFDDDGSKLGSERVVDWKPSIAKYGLVGGKVIESKGMRSAFQAHFMAAFIGRLICLRYGSKNLILDPISLVWNACVLESGDVISVSNPYVPDRVAGVLGITGKTFEVLDRTLDLMNGIVQAKVLDIDLLLFKEFLITPNGEASFPAASISDKNTYMFQCGADGKYSTGAPGNTLG